MRAQTKYVGGDYTGTVVDIRTSKASATDFNMINAKADDVEVNVSVFYFSTYTPRETKCVTETTPCARSSLYVATDA